MPYGDVRFLVDRTPPEASASWANGATATTTGSATLVVTATDNLAATADLRYEYSIDGGSTWVNMAGSTAVISMPGTGLRTVLVRVTDLAGNHTTKTLRLWVL